MDAVVLENKSFECHLNCGCKDGWIDRLMDGQTEDRTPISHLAKAGATTTVKPFLSKYFD